MQRAPPRSEEFVFHHALQLGATPRYEPPLSLLDPASQSVIQLSEKSPPRTLARPVVPNPAFWAIGPAWSARVYRRHRQGDRLHSGPKNRLIGRGSIRSATGWGATLPSNAACRALPAGSFRPPQPCG